MRFSTLGFFSWISAPRAHEYSIGAVSTRINLSAVTTTREINLLQVTSTPVIRVCVVSMDTSFHISSNETVGTCVRLRRTEISPFWLEVVLAALGVSNQVVWGVYGMDASFHGGSNDIIGVPVRPGRPEILLSSHGGILVLAQWFAILQEEHRPLSSQPSMTPTIKLFPGVVDTGQK